MERLLLGALVVVFIILIFLKMKLCTDGKTAPEYRLGNIIGYWYTHHHFGQARENYKVLAEPHHGTFAKFLIDHEPRHKVPDQNKNVLKDDDWWWDDLNSYKKIYPHFNNSLRQAFESFEGWNMKDGAQPNTCVVHLRVGDFLDESSRRLNVEKMIRATDKLPRTPEKFEILNGGKFHANTSETSLSIQKQSDAVIDDLVAKLQEKFPNSQILKIESENADHDFYRMVTAPMLLTGLGSFATMAAAINKNFRLTSGDSVRGGKQGNSELMYENWFTYT